MTGSIYAPDYLRSQDDKQLHLIADTMETNLNTMSNLRIENADLQKQVDSLAAENKRLIQINDRALSSEPFQNNAKLQQQIADYEKALKDIYAGDGLIPIDGKLNKEQTIAFEALDKYTE